MKTIPFGNDFYLRLRLVDTTTSGDAREMNLQDGDADYVVDAVTLIGLIGLRGPRRNAAEIKAVTEDGVICRVNGLRMGEYDVEMTGHRELSGDAWRAVKRCSIEIVYSKVEEGNETQYEDGTPVIDMELHVEVLGVGDRIMQADWTIEDETRPDFIKNKPDLSKKADKSDTYTKQAVNSMLTQLRTLVNGETDTKIAALGTVMHYCGNLDFFESAERSALYTAKKGAVFNVPFPFTYNGVTYPMDTFVMVKSDSNNPSWFSDRVHVFAQDLSGKADKSQVYTKLQTNELVQGATDAVRDDLSSQLNEKADKTNTYTKNEVNTALDGKVDKESGKGLSEEDYSSAEKAKLDALPTKSELDAELESKVDSTTLDDALTDYVKGKGFQVFQQPIHFDSTTRSAYLDAAFKKQLKKELMKVGFAEVVSDIAYLFEDDTRTNLIAQIPLTAYALKSQTYTKAQVDDIVAAVKQFEYEVVAELPTASAATKGKIYLVPSSNPKTQNVKDEFITTEDNGVFAWEQIGTTTIDLSDYYNKHEVDTKLATKASVSNVYTRTQTDNKLNEKADVSDVEALETAVGSKPDKAGVMFNPAQSTFADSSKELLFQYYDASQAGGTNTMRVIIPAPQAQADWAETSSSAKSFIKNKPTIYTQAEVDELLAANGLRQLFLRSDFRKESDPNKCRYNSDTGYYEMNGISDLTEDDMWKIYKVGEPPYQAEKFLSTAILWGGADMRVRTTFPTMRTNFQSTVRYGENQNLLEVLCLNPIGSFVIVLSLNSPLLVNAAVLHTIIGTIDCIGVVAGAELFRNCPMLKNVQIYRVNKNITVTAPKISYDSMAYMVAQATNTTAITIKVASETYSYLTGQATPPEDVGGTSEQWQELAATATNKQIAFAV